MSLILDMVLLRNYRLGYKSIVQQGFCMTVMGVNVY